MSSAVRRPRGLSSVDARGHADDASTTFEARPRVVFAAGVDGPRTAFATLLSDSDSAPEQLAVYAEVVLTLAASVPPLPAWTG